MDGLIEKVMIGSFAVALLFIMLTAVIIPNWNTAGSANVSGTGLSQASWQGLVLILGVAFIFGIAIALIFVFMKRKK
jgi:hypothetical protein